MTTRLTLTTKHESKESEREVMQTPQPDPARQLDAVIAELGRDVERALYMASAMMEKEKAIRIGCLRDIVAPMKVVFFNTDRSIITLHDSLFETNSFDERDETAFAMRLCANVFDTYAMLLFAEAWSAGHCAACGFEIDGVEYHCSACGEPFGLPSANPHREEVITGVLQIRNRDKKAIWTSRIVRDGSGTITGFTDETGPLVNPISPDARFENPWRLKSWMLPHAVFNHPLIAEALGRDVKEHALYEAQAIASSFPSDFELLRIDPKRMERALYRLNPDSSPEVPAVQAHVNQGSDTCAPAQDEHCSFQRLLEDWPPCDLDVDDVQERVDESDTK